VVPFGDEMVMSNQRESIVIENVSGQKLKKIATDTDRDFFMNSKEAKAYGVVDSVLKKR